MTINSQSSQLEKFVVFRFNRNSKQCMCLGIFILSVVPLIRSAKGAPAVNKTKLATDVASEGNSQTTKFIQTDKNLLQRNQFVGYVKNGMRRNAHKLSCSGKSGLISEGIFSLVPFLKNVQNQ